MKKCILLIEPETEICGFLQADLQKKGFDVVCPIDSYAGFEYAQSHRLDLAIFNAQQPIINGIDFLKALRESGFQMPTIVFSNHTSPQLRDTFCAYAPCIHIQKPFQMDHLLKQIDDLFKIG